MSKDITNKQSKTLASLLCTKNKIMMVIALTMLIVFLAAVICYPDRLTLTITIHLYLFITIMFLIERILFWYITEIKNGWH